MKISLLEFLRVINYYNRRINYGYLKITTS